jgi:hypothetical protein
MVPSGMPSGEVADEDADYRDEVELADEHLHDRKGVSERRRGREVARTRSWLER